MEGGREGGVILTHLTYGGGEPRGTATGEPAAAWTPPARSCQIAKVFKSEK